MDKEKEIDNNIFTLDDLFQQSVDINNFLKGKINQTNHESTNEENITLFFSQRIKLRNASKNEYWEKSNSPDNVRQLI